ncbi:hypothetical protein, partial [Campylobacter coli]
AERFKRDRIKNILPLEEKLKERKLDKWMERVGR